MRTSLFEERAVISFQVLFWKWNDNETSRIIKGLDASTNYKLKCRFFWKGRRDRYPFILKKPFIDKANIIYNGYCSFKVRQNNALLRKHLK